MSMVPLVSLMHVRDAAPGLDLSASGAAATAAQERAERARPSRSEPTAGPAPTTTTTPAPTTTAPTTTTAKAAPSTTAKPSPATPQRQEGEASHFTEAQSGTCAHRTLPLGTVVKVTNLTNGRSTTCRVADRGPYADGRILDLSTAGFTELASISAGVVRVRIEW